MPIKTWAPNERLTSADLNAAFAQAAQGRMPGCINTTGVAKAWTSGQTLELPPGAPTVDQGGFWNAASSRYVVPAGLGGLYLFVVPVEAVAGGAIGDLVRVNSNGMGNANAYETFARSSATAMGGTLVVSGVLGDAAVVFAQAYSQTAASLINRGSSLIRLASLGLY